MSSVEVPLDELLDAWRANNALNVELLGACADEDLDLKPGKGKTIRSNYVHIVGVRRMWCEHGGRGRGAAVPAADIPKLDWKAATRKQILHGLEASNEAMCALFHRKAASSKGRWTLGLFFAYCIAHEAHHRSQIEIALRINGREPDDGFLYGLWEWDKKL